MESESINARLTTRPDASEYAPYYERYVSRVPDGDPIEHLRVGIDETVRLFTSPAGLERAGFRYEPGKWTMGEVAGHLADTERVMAYRALRFARGDEFPLATFDENAWTPAGRFDRLAIDRLVGNLVAVRSATLSLFEALPDEAWDRGGPIAETFFSVRALAWIIAGHELHHQAIIRDRYLA